MWLGQVTIVKTRIVHIARQKQSPFKAKYSKKTSSYFQKFLRLLLIFVDLLLFAHEKTWRSRTQLILPVAATTVRHERAMMVAADKRDAFV